MAVVDIKCLCFLCYLVVSGELLAAAQGVAKADSSLGHKKHSQDKHGDRLLAEQGDASDQAPGPDAMDLSVTGACAVDIVHHCAHILKVTS